MVSGRARWDREKVRNSTQPTYLEEKEKEEGRYRYQNFEIIV